MTLSGSGMLTDRRDVFQIRRQLCGVCLAHVIIATVVSEIQVVLNSIFENMQITMSENAEATYGG